LDTITFKTSEEVTISSITLERYGYSTIDDIETVQLEDEDGNVIADAKEPNSKGQVKLTLKKDYKTVDGTFKATVVVTTRTLPGTAAPYNDPKLKNGSTLGFKVISAESTAKNLNLDDYNPYTYDLVNYAGSAVQFSSRNSATKDHNFEAGEAYEIAKFRVKAPADAAILVKGFTLTDDQLTEDAVVTWKGNVIDADKYAKDVTVTINGKEVKGLKWNINKSDELVISFNEVEIAWKETATIAVSMSFTEEFDNFWKSVQYYIADLTKFNAIDKKTETRVSDPTKTLEALRANKKWTVYTFKGGKIKLSGTKLWVVNAAAGSTNVKVAEWEINITEAIRWDVVVTLKDNDSVTAIDEIRLVVNGEEYDGTRDAANKKFTFKGVEIEKSGKVEVRVDLKSSDELGAISAITFAESLNSASFINFKYDETSEPIDSDRISGSLSVSNVRIQAAKANLKNNNTKKVELVIGETNRKTIFEGTYEAKKWAVTLKNFEVTSTAPLAINAGSTKMPTFYVTIDNEEYDANWLANNCKDASNNAIACAKWDIDDIEVADGKSVNVKVEIEYTPADAANGGYNTFNIALEWEDEDNNEAGKADEDTVRVEVVKQGTIDVTDSSAKKTVLLRSDRTVAEFRIKPSKSSDDEIILNTFKFRWLNGAIKTATAATDEEWLKINIDGDDYTTTSNPKIVADGNDWKIENIGTSIPAEWLVVKVSLKSEYETATKRMFIVSEINGKAINSEFTKYYVPAKLKITQNNAKGKDTTTYTAELDNDTSLTVAALKLYVDQVSWACPAGTTAGTITWLTTKCVIASKDSLSEWSAEDNKFSANNADSARSITAISYEVGTISDQNPAIVILKSEFENFFENAYGDDDLMVYSNKS